MIRTRIELKTPLANGDREIRLDDPDVDRMRCVTARMRPNLLMMPLGKGWRRVNLEMVGRVEIWVE